MINFWNEIDKPVIALAPMEDVTDTVFREIILGISNPGTLKVLFAEFTSTDGLCHDIGRDKVKHRLFVSQAERELLSKHNVKLVAQIWGGDPENFRKATQMLCKDYKFDGIDINMGCPIKKITRQAACSDLIKYPALAREIIQAVKEYSNIPVSVKTRTGLKQHTTEEWISNLLQAGPDALILHARTQKMMYAYPADWREIAKAAAVRNEVAQGIPLLGNGDVMSMADAFNKADEYGIEGIMIGRGIFKNPWIFNPGKPATTPQERLAVLLRHSELFVSTWAGEKNYAIMKRFFKIYASDFAGASELREKLMKSRNHEETKGIVEGFLC